MKKLKLVAILMIIMLIINIIAPINKAQAALFNIDRARLYSKEEMIPIAINGVRIGIAYVVYLKDGVEYPAYCMDRTLDGVEFDIQYDVTVDSYISNVLVWRCITNGYPYVSPAQLGANSDAEAFAITKIATYDMLYNYNWDEFEALSEQGERIIAGAKSLSEKARSMNTTKPSCDIQISPISEGWRIDNIDSTCISKEYELKSQIGVNEYEIKFTGKVPEDAKIVDINNKEKQFFENGERFKVIMPVQYLTTDGEFNLFAKAKVNTKPIYYGKSTVENKQSYALTGIEWEFGVNNYTEKYFRNDTQIQVIKKDGEDGMLLKGVEFNLLDENKKIIHQNIVTDENGIAIIKNLLPGTYYLQETKTLDCYTLYDELIQIDINLNEIYKVTVNNTKEKLEIVVTDNNKEIEKEYEAKGATIIKELPRTGY